MDIWFNRTTAPTPPGNDQGTNCTGPEIAYHAGYGAELWSWAQPYEPHWRLLDRAKAELARLRKRLGLA